MCLPVLVTPVCRQDLADTKQAKLNAVAALQKESRLEVRAKLVEYLSKVEITTDVKDSAFHRLADVQMHFPMHTHNFSDFYCSFEHTKNVRS